MYLNSTRNDMKGIGRNLVIISPMMAGVAAFAFAPKPVNDYSFWQIVLWGSWGLSVVLLFVLRDRTRKERQ